MGCQVKLPVLRDCPARVSNFFTQGKVIVVSGRLCPVYFGAIMSYWTLAGLSQFRLITIIIESFPACDLTVNLSAH